MPENSDDALHARLKKLSEGLTTQKEEMKSGNHSTKAPLKVDGIGAAYSLAMRVMAEFIGGVVVGLLLGWQFDRWLGTSPWLLIIFLLLGTVAGFWNVYRIAAAPTGNGAKPQDLPVDLKSDADEDN